MKTNRERIGVLVISLILTALLLEITGGNLYEKIVSFMLYLVSFIFITIDTYVSLRYKSIYHRFSLCRGICILAISVISIHYLWSREFMIYIGLVIILAILAIKFSKLASKNLPYII